MRTVTHEPSEKLIQKAILDYLRVKRIYAIRVNSGRIAIDRRLIKLAEAGTPDIIVCLQGHFIGLEVKAAKGKLTEAQTEAHQRIELSGGQVFVVRSVDDVRKIIEETK